MSTDLGTAAEAGEALPPAGRAPRPTAPSEARRRLRALWAAEDRALRAWTAAQTAYERVSAEHAAKVTAAQERRVKAMLPFTPQAWGKVQASHAPRPADDGWTGTSDQAGRVRQRRQDPWLIERVAGRVEAADQRLATAQARADRAIRDAARRRADATRHLRDLHPQAHLVLGISKAELSRMAPAG